MFNNYPYSDMHEINLDWFLQQFQALKTLVNNMESILTALQSLPDASGASDGQVLTADGNGGWQWETPVTSDIDVPVKQAIVNLLLDAVYNNPDHAADKAVIQAWLNYITAITLSASTLSFTSQAAQTLTATTTPNGGVVSWSSSDTSIATVSNGVVIPVSNGSCTITAASGNVSAACAVTVSAFVTVVSISAVYTQGGTVYSTDTLDSLKNDLVVTATYSDNTTATVAGSDYTLYGTLDASTSTITVSYGGQSDTFDITVTVLDLVDYIESSGTQYIDTGITIAYYDEVFTKLYDGVTVITDTLYWGCSDGTHRIALGPVKTNSQDNYSFRWTGNASPTVTRATNAIVTIEARNNVDTTLKTLNVLDENGDLLLTTNATGGAEANVPNLTCYLFARHGTGGAQYPASFRLYEFIIKNQSGTERMHLLPVLDNGVACLFDTVSRQYFYNSGTGNFTYA